MEKYKKLKASIIALLSAILLALSTALIVISNHAVAVYAADRYVELDGNSVFYTQIRGAEVSTSSAIKEPDDKGEEKDHYYTQFNIEENETVAYRQNLAYSWIVGDKAEDNKEQLTGTTHGEKFSMQLGFANLNFKRFIISFQSQQYSSTKDGKTENFLIITPVDEDKGRFMISTSTTLEEDGDKIKGQKDYGTFINKNDRVTVSFGDYDKGTYKVLVNGNESDLAFENVYEGFATYVSSGDNAVTPLTFSAQFEENQQDKLAQMILFAINGQSFEQYLNGGVYKVIDTAAPVMCFSETPSFLEYGKSISFKYRVIDVLASSPRSTAYYYVLTGEQYESDKFDYDKYIYEESSSSTDGDKTEGEDKKDEFDPDKSYFIKVTSSSSNRIIRDDKTFIPQQYLKGDSISNVYGLVKIYYEISDVSGSSAQKDYVFVDWYAKDEALVDIYGADFKNVDGKSSNFIKLIDDKEGATYASDGDEGKADPEAAYKNSVKAFQEYYQGEIDKAIEALEDGKLYAGGEKFYLPSIEWDFVDEYFTGKDYKYSIYYRAKTSGSNTSLEANKLAIDLNDADVKYRFTIFITDSFGNPMRYPTLENNNLTWKTIETDDVWDEDYSELLPFFEFDVSYKSATAEDPEDLSLAYVNSNYSGVSFKITGVTNTYTSRYKLYVFDRNAYLKDHPNAKLDYATFNANVSKLFNNEYEDGNTRKYFTTVKATSELLETDANYEEFKELNWNSSSISFTPQSVEDFYVVELTLTDNRSQHADNYYATVAASVQTTALKGESDWLEKNLTSVILLSVAGACLIALIVLLVVKPKDKGDIDAVYSEVESKSSKKSKKN